MKFKLVGHDGGASEVNTSSSTWSGGKPELVVCGNGVIVAAPTTLPGAYQGVPLTCLRSGRTSVLVVVLVKQVQAAFSNAYALITHIYLLCPPIIEASKISARVSGPPRQPPGVADGGPAVISPKSCATNSFPGKFLEVIKISQKFPAGEMLKPETAQSYYNLASKNQKPETTPSRQLNRHAQLIPHLLLSETRDRKEDRAVITTTPSGQPNRVITTWPPETRNHAIRSAQQTAQLLQPYLSLPENAQLLQPRLQNQKPRHQVCPTELLQPRLQKPETTPSGQPNRVITTSPPDTKDHAIRSAQQSYYNLASRNQRPRHQVSPTELLQPGLQTPETTPSGLPNRVITTWPPETRNHAIRSAQQSYYNLASRNQRPRHQVSPTELLQPGLQKPETTPSGQPNRVITTWPPETRNHAIRSAQQNYYNLASRNQKPRHQVSPTELLQPGLSLPETAQLSQPRLQKPETTPSGQPNRVITTWPPETRNHAIRSAQQSYYNLASRNQKPRHQVSPTELLEPRLQKPETTPSGQPNRIITTWPPETRDHAIRSAQQSY
ncbi:uncharacterized protein LOC119586671 [Penaeus monodon]|uniref:uncharacterized protein LOC119586671 n=1 Tax=Penaeus monodon TaxID=6687 RepID=UPI0018A7C910|nr:uncharacterized protein LOC119586671 [Penaeus monodon]